MKFCCSGFEGAYLVNKKFGPNIRIVKFRSEFLIEKQKTSLKFFITTGYGQFSLDLPKMNINYCPYCGATLKRKYNKDEYANEVEGETFVL